MTNFEFWKDTLAEIVETGGAGANVAIVNDKPVRCSEIHDCKKCDRCGKCNEATLIKWLMEKHIEKPKLTKKERMFCELVETGWIARDKDNKIWLHFNNPTKRADEWYGVGYSMYHVFKGVTPFSFIKWEDEEPWAVEDLLKLEVEQ